MNVFFEWLNRLGQRYLELLPTATFQATLVAIVVLVAVLLLKRRSSHLCYALLLVALVKFALPGIQAPWSPFPRLAATKSTDDFDVNASASSVDKLASLGPAERPGFIEGQPLLGATQDESKRASEDLAPKAPRDIAYQPAGARLTGAAWMLLVQLLGTAMFLALLVFDALRLQRLIRAAEPVDERQRLVLDGLVQRLNMRRRPRLLVSDLCSVPFAAGLLRPLVMLPRRSLERLDATELEAVLLHELLHLRRGDLWINLLQLWVRACWWWHPLVWYLNRQIKTVREDCCDDALLAQGAIDAERYCETLLTIARDAVNAGPSRLSVSMTVQHPLGHRIRRIMDSQIARRDHFRLGSAMMIFVLAILVLPTAPTGQSVGDSDMASDVDTRPLLPMVVDEQNRPLGGAHLAISYERAYAPFWMKPLRVWSTKTGDEGRPQDLLPSEIKANQPARQGRLWVYRPGIGLATIALPIDQPLKTIPQRIRLLGHRSTVFTIETADGRPANGTQVRIISFYEDGISTALPDHVSDAFTATADERGIARLPQIDGGWINSIELIAPGGAKEMISIFSRQITDRGPLWPKRIVLGAVGKVSGNVTGLAAPSRQSTRVFLISQNGEGLIRSDDDQEVSHVRYVDLPLDADGGFRGNAVPVGPLGGRIYRDDQWLGAFLPTYTVRAGEVTSMELQAEPLASVSFPVIDAETEMPIVGARVLVSGSNRVDNSAIGVDGNWPVVQLPRGATHHYSFDLPTDFLPLPWRVFKVSVPDSVDAHSTPVFRARRSVQIEAKVLQADGPVGDGYRAVVSWKADPQQEYSMPGSMTASVRADGKCELRVPKDEPFTVRILVAGVVVAEKEELKWQADRKEMLTFSVPVLERDSISGRVIDDQGDPVPGIDVSIKKYWTDGVNNFGFADLATVRTDQSGVYQTPGASTANASYFSAVSPSNDEWESDDSVKIQRRDDQSVIMEDLRVRPTASLSNDSDMRFRRKPSTGAVD